MSNFLDKKSLSASFASPINRKALDLLEEGLAAYNRGNSGQARLKFKEAIALEPEFAAAYFFLGSLLFEEDELDAALTALENALTIDPHNEDLSELISSINKFLADS